MSDHVTTQAGSQEPQEPQGRLEPRGASREPTPVALITGGSRGIGRALVEALLERGWRVDFCSRSEESVSAALDSLAGQLGGAQGRLKGSLVDVTDAVAVAGWVERAAERWGRVDCLVNNAGLGVFAAVDAISVEQWRQVLGTNLDGCFYGMRAVAPILRRQGHGWIFNIGSLASRHAFATGAAYNASKFGLLGLTEAAMLDLRSDGVRVAAVLPGSVDTDFRPPGKVEDTSWMLTAEDVAQVVVDLLDYPERALPSCVEIRPSRPKKR